MLGAIIGDVVGSRFEFSGSKKKDFEMFTAYNRFTDDTVMTCAIALALLNCNNDYSDLENKTIYAMQELGNKYPDRGYGERFNFWLSSIYPKPYNSYGNGSAMRVSSVAYVAKSIEELKFLSNKVSCVTHNHPEGIKGAEAVAVAIWLALNKKTKEEIKEYITTNYYKLKDNYDNLPREFLVDVTCQGTVPLCFYAFFVSNSYEETIRNAIAFGGDADTMACIAGSIAEAYYGIPKTIKIEIYKYLDKKLIDIIDKFRRKFVMNKKMDYKKQIKLFIDNNVAIASCLQRHFRIGYHDACEIIDRWRDKGYISKTDDTKSFSDKEAIKKELYDMFCR